jgi:GT2 family glycosyltransferase
VAVTIAAVPTLAQSPHLADTLRSLQDQGLSVVLVHQGSRPLTREVEALAEQVIRRPRNLGFAAATNLALAESQGDFVATVNDDVIIRDGWLEHLVAALKANPRAAAAQGVNLKLTSPDSCDGCGLAWNRWWQATQLRRHQTPPAASPDPIEVFGVSATAAVYRRAALLEVGPETRTFDTRLQSYYEDMELACRLREHRWKSLLVPAARAHHAQSATGQTMPRRKLFYVYRNRYLVAASLLGRSFWAQLPRIWLRDAADVWHLLSAGRLGSILSVKAAWIAAFFQYPSWGHGRTSRVPKMELRRLSAENWEASW